MMENVTPTTHLGQKTRCLNAILLAFLSATAAFAQDAPKTISRSEANGAAVTKVQPVYPAMARQLKIEGVVELEAVVTETGAVERVNIVSGNPMLTKPAAEALKQWKFSPFHSDGKPIKALAQVSMNFRL